MDSRVNIAIDSLRVDLRLAPFPTDLPRPIGPTRKRVDDLTEAANAFEMKVAAQPLPRGKAIGFGVGAGLPQQDCRVPRERQLFEPGSGSRFDVSVSGVGEDRSAASDVWQPRGLPLGSHRHEFRVVFYVLEALLLGGTHRGLMGMWSR